MKAALLLCFIGIYTVSAVTPFEAIVEEWEVGIWCPLKIFLMTNT